MKKHGRTKLPLSRQTIRALETTLLRQVDGGMTNQSRPTECIDDPCPTTGTRLQSCTY